MPDWPVEYETLSEADRGHDLPAEDLERLAVAAFMLGRDDEVVPLRERAIHDYVADGRRADAVACGFWIGWHLMMRGDLAQAQGWTARLRRLADDDPRLEGMLAQQTAVARMWGGDPAGALPDFERSVAIAARGAETDVLVLALLGRGRCLQLLGRDDECMVVMDEAMTYVSAGRVQPQVAGLLYCAVIDMCMGHFDLARAQEWTRALTAWIDDHDGAVAYRGTCLVHRAEILQLRGAWTEAAERAVEACALLDIRPEPAVAAAHYRVGELARLRGRLDEAEAAYERASELGLEVQPGLALLRLAQGRPDAALAGLDRVLGESSDDPRARPLQLAARVEICLAAGAVGAAEDAAASLAMLSGPEAPPFLCALVEHATGAVLLARGEARDALPRLRRAWTLWRDVDAPYEAARARSLVARACDALGDTDAAVMEADAARAALDRLGAVGEPFGVAGTTVDGPLSPRELEVLRLVATGATNRAIAAELVLSEKTVARHVSNIFGKLALPNRAAATAYAFEHRLV
ncbi:MULTISPECIES: LuxR family transcriptional regulator [Mumia]|uniref:LuxR C-terminal-related transcriptional regulator n=1 Tax=Mumia xiangluensis TaxID=1678900 RepID=A0ABW1QNT2_9ACTN|nr:MULTISPECIES: LuxR family transcriptional regulator [Mumia]